MYYLTLLMTELELMMRAPGLLPSLVRLAAFAAVLGIQLTLAEKIKSSKAKTFQNF